MPVLVQGSVLSLGMIVNFHDSITLRKDLKWYFYFRSKETTGIAQGIALVRSLPKFAAAATKAWICKCSPFPREPKAKEFGLNHMRDPCTI